MIKLYTILKKKTKKLLTLKTSSSKKSKKKCRSTVKREILPQLLVNVDELQPSPNSVGIAAKYAECMNSTSFSNSSSLSPINKPSFGNMIDSDNIDDEEESLPEVQIPVAKQAAPLTSTHDPSAEIDKIGVDLTFKSVLSKQEEAPSYEDFEKLNNELKEKYGIKKDLSAIDVKTGKTASVAAAQMNPVEEEEESVPVETYVTYQPKKLKIGHEHPDLIVETASLASVEPPEISYKLKMPESVYLRGKLSALQLEAVVYSCKLKIIENKKKVLTYRIASKCPLVYKLFFLSVNFDQDLEIWFSFFFLKFHPIFSFNFSEKTSPFICRS